MFKALTHRMLALGALLGILLFGQPASAASATDFFKGKTMTYIVATSPGGGYDTYQPVEKGAIDRVSLDGET